MTEEEFLSGVIRKHRQIQAVNLAEEAVREGNKYQSLERDYNCHRNKDEKFYKSYGRYGF